jgi:hypothetical protein
MSRAPPRDCAEQYGNSVRDSAQEQGFGPNRLISHPIDKVIAAAVTDDTEVKSVIEKLRDKYGANDVTA